MAELQTITVDLEEYRELKRLEKIVANLPGACADAVSDMLDWQKSSGESEEDDG
jgi:hypothetical protein